MANPIAWADPEIERVEELVLEEADALLQCPTESEKETTREVLSKLVPHSKGRWTP